MPGAGSLTGVVRRALCLLGTAGVLALSPWAAAQEPDTTVSVSLSTVAPFQATVPDDVSGTAGTDPEGDVAARAGLILLGATALLAAVATVLRVRVRRARLRSEGAHGGVPPPAPTEAFAGTQALAGPPDVSSGPLPHAAGSGS